LSDNLNLVDKQLDPICLELTRTLEGIGAFQRRFFPPEIRSLREDLLPFREPLERARLELQEITMPSESNEQRKIIDDSLGLVLDVLGTILRAPTTDFQETIVQVMRSFRRICRVQENLYPIRFTSPHLNRFFLESQIDTQDERLDPSPQKETLVGLHHFGIEDEYYARGAVSLYVPEYYDDAIEWPLVIALHGGFAHGRDFIWTWLREARSRGFILLSPTSRDTTWSILNPETDGKAITSMLDFFKKHYNFNTDRMLLTGISDGATFALICSLQQDSPFTSCAPIAGVLPPLNIDSARGKQ
jgi:phospholipase/carboxylesterase